MVAVTETSAATQALANAAPERLPQSLPQASTPAKPTRDAPLGGGSEATKAEAAPAAPASPIGFTLHYDSDLQRLILEARDPVSGYVIVQIPPKYVLKQFSATDRAHLGAPRGTGVNDAI
jgi:hypothetical protein